MINKHKKAVLLQRWPRNVPYIWVPWKFWDSLTMPTSTFAKKTTTNSRTLTEN